MTIERTKAALHEAMAHVSNEVALRTTNPNVVGTVARLPVTVDSAGTALNRVADFLLVAVCVYCRGQAECKDWILGKSSGYTNPASK